MGKSETEQKILSAAREEFLAKGYDGTRMRSIAERAEINKGLLHYYFKSKEALLVHVFRETFGELFQAMQTALDEHMDVFEQIEAVVSVHTDFHLKHPQVSKFVVSEMNRDPQSHTLRMKKAGVAPPNALLIESIEKAKLEGRIRADINSKSLMLHIISLVLFPVVGKPMVKYMHDLNEVQYKQLLKQRKSEITAFIIQAIKA